jgi:hypothetical protein
MTLPSVRLQPGHRKLLILVLAALGWLLLAEAGYRVYRMAKGRTYSRAWAEARIDELVADLHGQQFEPAEQKSDLAKDGMAVHPYQGYQVGLYTRTSDELAHYFATPEAKANFDVLLLGGSVAAEFSNWAPVDFLPELERDPRLAGREVRLHTAACPGHKQPQHALTLQWLLSQGWKPDAVLLLDGYNELAVSAENAGAGVNPLFPYWIEMQIRLGSAPQDSEDLHLLGRAVAAREEADELGQVYRGSARNLSAILGLWQIHRLENAVRRARQRQQDIQEHERVKLKAGRSLTVRGGSFDADPLAVQEQAIEAWREGSLSMQAMCRVRGITFLHVLQPSPCDAGSKPLTPEEAEDAKNPPVWAAAVARGYPRLREVGAELAREGVSFFDASRVFADHAERIYRDGCHFGSPGFAVLGPLMAQGLLRAWKE